MSTRPFVSPIRAPRVAFRALLAIALFALVLASCRAPEKTAERASLPREPEAAQAGSTATPAPIPSTPADTEKGASAAPAMPPPPAEPPTDFAPGTPRQKELLQKAMAQVAMDELDAGAIYLLTILQEPPPSLEQLVATLVLAEVYRTEERYDRGILRVERQAAYFPPTAELSMALAGLYQGAKRPADARTALRKAAEIAPERLDVLTAWVYAEAESEQGGAENPRLAEASKAYELALPELVERLQAAQPEEIVALLETVGSLRDERLAEPLAALLGNSDMRVVGAALEALVNGGYRSVAPRLRQVAGQEAREQVREGLTSAADYLEQAKAPENVREMPHAGPEKAGN